MADAESAIRLAVAGAHLSGQPLNHQLTDLGARLVQADRTEPQYRLYALPTDPPKPGLVRVGEDDPAGGSIEVEVWSLTSSGFGRFVDGVPAPLTIGRVRLVEQGEVAGFLCESIATVDAEEITSYGGWRPYLAR